MNCPHCNAGVPPDVVSCPTCGRSFSDSFIATKQLNLSPKASPTSTPVNSLDNGRFVPGDMLANRYRIASLLGRGGMGEVYRADDLKLSQTVALKFLPESLSRKAEPLERFLREVRVARQVSHQNVCRVYDIGE